METKHKTENKLLNNSKQPDSQNDWSNILMIKKLTRIYLVEMMTQVRPKRNANIANMYWEIASCIKSVVIQDDVKVQNIAIILTQSYSAHRRLLHPFSLTGNQYSTSLKPKMCLKMRMKRIIMIMQTLLLITLMIFSPVRVKFLDLLSRTFNHNC